MSTIQETINRLRELERAAAPAPWRWYDYYFEDWPECESDLTNEHLMIMHARNAIPALLAEIDRLTAENTQLLDTVAEAWDEGYLDKETEAPEEMIVRGLRKRAQNPYRENKVTRQ